MADIGGSPAGVRATHVIRDLEALKTIADPLRLRIYEVLTDRKSVV